MKAIQNGIKDIISSLSQKKKRLLIGIVVYIVYIHNDILLLDNYLSILFLGYQSNAQHIKI